MKKVSQLPTPGYPEVVQGQFHPLQATLEDSQIGQDRTSQRGTRGGKKEEHWAEKRPAERLAP
ncbi:TPA: hypothetical protein ACH3X2_008341 [Trebouxia sp. C0005]